MYKYPDMYQDNNRPSFKVNRKIYRNDYQTPYSPYYSSFHRPLGDITNKGYKKHISSNIVKNTQNRNMQYRFNGHQIYAEDLTRPEEQRMPAQTSNYVSNDNSRTSLTFVMRRRRDASSFYALWTENSTSTSLTSQRYLT